jgi:hypothetical protein
VYVTPTVALGGTMEFWMAQPVQQTWIHLEVDYPNGQKVSLGDKRLEPQPGGGTKADWTWTVPATMTAGTGTVVFTGACGALDLSGSATFVVSA